MCRPQLQSWSAGGGDLPPQVHCRLLDPTVEEGGGQQDERNVKEQDHHRRQPVVEKMEQRKEDRAVEQIGAVRDPAQKLGDRGHEKPAEWKERKAEHDHHNRARAGDPIETDQAGAVNLEKDLRDDLCEECAVPVEQQAQGQEFPCDTL